MAKGTKGFQPGNKEGLNSRFTSSRQPKRRGRKPSLYKYIKDQAGINVDVELSKEDFLKVIQFVMEQNSDTLESLVKGSDGKANKKTPLWLLNIISAINTDIRYGRTTTLELMFDRVFGKSTTRIEGDMETTVKSTPDLSALSTEELLMLNELLEKAHSTGVESLPGK